MECDKDLDDGIPMMKLCSDCLRHLAGDQWWHDDENPQDAGDAVNSGGGSAGVLRDAVMRHGAQRTNRAMDAYFGH